MKNLNEPYRDPDLSRHLSKKIHRISSRKVRLMEVCGTHTVSIFRHGIRDLIPETISLVSGPGCPVCVTAQEDIDAFVALARHENVIVTTFGDLMRVPGAASSLEKERANGRTIQIIYSVMDALSIARQNPDKLVVFLAVGFETTVPTTAAAILSARHMKLTNFCIYSSHKTVPPALAALMAMENTAIDGFLLPGHVSVIIGLDAYAPFFESHRLPCAVGGFEPADILQAAYLLINQIESKAPELVNAYPRAVSKEGNHKAQEVMRTVFKPADANWRGIGKIPASGLALRKEYTDMDAVSRLELEIKKAPEPPGCACGEILTGVKIPPTCPLYKTACTPVNPVGPCMVSTEGTCAAYYRYHED